MLSLSLQLYIYRQNKKGKKSEVINMFGGVKKICPKEYIFLNNKPL